MRPLLSALLAVAGYALLPSPAVAAPLPGTLPPGLVKEARHPLHTAPAPPSAPAQRRAGAAVAAAGSPAGYIPCDVRNAYGMAGSSLTGAGQTIAVVDYADQPTAASDLNAFDSDLGLPGIALQVVKLGAPPADPGWAHEITLDVQWAHAIAPGARLVLVETSSSSVGSGVSNGLMQGVQYAVGPAVNADIVSMSWGTSASAADVSFMQSLDTMLAPTNAAGRRVTYVASAGDGGFGPEWPAISPRVIGVGGTTLQPPAFGYPSQPPAHLTCSPTLPPGANPGNETVWGSPTGGQGTGGGSVSGYSKPGFQAGFGPAGARSLPDVAALADPSTGVATVQGGAWATYLTGGTSLAAPIWAGVTALLNQARAAAGLGAELSPNWVYAAAAGDYNDVSAGAAAPAGDTSCVAATTCTGAPGYDMVTGRGSPKFAALSADQTSTAPAPAPSPSLAPTPTPTPTPAPPPGPAPTYTAIWPWYDNASPGVGSDNIHVLNPGASSVTGQVKLGSMSAQFSLGPAQETFMSFPRGIAGGPLVVTANGRVIAVQRVQYYQSFSEVAAVPTSAGANDLYFTWFDRVSDPGFASDDIFVANPNNTATAVTVSIPGQPGCSSTQTVQPGADGIFTCSSGFGGMVHVSADLPVIASQRVHYYQTFNEVMASSALPAGTYYLTWYDHASDPRFKSDNIHVGYPAGRGTASVSVPGCSPSVVVSTAAEDVFSCPAGRGFGGPVTVTTSVPTIVTQRVEYGSSFNETPALSPARDGGTVLYMAWYDRASDAGFRADNIHIYFPGGSGRVTSVSVPRCSPGGGQVSNELVFSCPSGSGFGGPVVINTDTPALAAQRVEYYDTFNEAAGSP